MKRILAFGLMGLSLISSPAYAADFNVSNAHVTLVEGTYTPNDVRFSIDQNGGACTAGSFLHYYSQGSSYDDRAANAAAVMSILLTAKATGTRVSIGGHESGCVVAYVIAV